MDNVVVINFLGNCGTCGMSLTSTLDFIKKVLRAELNDQSIEVLSDLLIFFLGRTKTQNFIYSS